MIFIKIFNIKILNKIMKKFLENDINNKFSRINHINISDLLDLENFLQSEKSIDSLIIDY